jgi:hypothetical protein
MFNAHRDRIVPVVLTCIAIGSTTTSASAITVEVAKKCDELLAKEFPPREPGNPAAGSTNGSALHEQAYFSKCVANGGNMDDHPAPEGDHPPQGDDHAPAGAK